MRFVARRAGVSGLEGPASFAIGLATTEAYGHMSFGVTAARSVRTLPYNLMA